MNYNIKLLPIQKKLYNSTKTIAGIYSGRSVGKTYIMSWLIVLDILQGKKCLAFAQDYSALTKCLFQEIYNRFIELGITPNYNKSSMCISHNGGLVYGFSYAGYESCRGQTNCHSAYFDEIALAPESLFAVVAPCLRGNGIVPKIRFASTPRAGGYWNNMILDAIRTKEWDVYTGTMLENSFIDESSKRLVLDSIKDNFLLRQEIYGEILDNVIENCIVDLPDFGIECKGRDNTYYCGMDFARYGVDTTCICIRNKFEIVDMIYLPKADTQMIVNEYNKLDRIYKIKETYLDGTGGFSIGFYDAMKGIKNNIFEINFAQQANNSIIFSNIRTEMYDNLAVAIKDGFYINGNKYKNIIDEIKSTSYIIGQNGKKQLVPKEIIKKLLGRSPDGADALALSFCNKKEETNFVVNHKRCAQLTKLFF